MNKRTQHTTLGNHGGDDEIDDDNEGKSILYEKAIQTHRREIQDECTRGMYTLSGRMHREARTRGSGGPCTEPGTEGGGGTVHTQRSRRRKQLDPNTGTRGQATTETKTNASPMPFSCGLRGSSVTRLRR